MTAAAGSRAALPAGLPAGAARPFSSRPLLQGRRDPPGRPPARCRLGTRSILLRSRSAGRAPRSWRGQLPGKERSGEKTAAAEERQSETGHLVPFHSRPGLCRGAAPHGSASLPPPHSGTPAAGLARRHRCGPAGGAAGGGRALSGAALQSRRGLRRERSGHGSAPPWRSALRSAARSG